MLFLNTPVCVSTIKLRITFEGPNLDLIMFTIFIVIVIHKYIREIKIHKLKIIYLSNITTFIFNKRTYKLIDLYLFFICQTVADYYIYLELQIINPQFELLTLLHHH